jgi:regulator of sigma E protease
MNVLIQAGQLILSLGLLILLHEFGHFITARMFKTRVEKFYLFFDFLFPLPGVLNFALWKKKIGETEYGIGWFPMGGYVSIAGMVDESLNTEELEKPAQPWEFRAKPAWQRLIIMLGGIIVNVLVAFLVYAMVLGIWGERMLPMNSLKDGLWADSAAVKIGFKTGDKVISVDGKPVTYYDDLISRIVTGEDVKFERNGQIQEIKMPKDLIDQLAKKKNFSFLELRIPVFIGQVPDTSFNKTSGLLAGDKVMAINDSIKISYLDQWREELPKLKNNTITLTIERNKELKQIPVKVNSEGRIGIVLGNLKFEELEKLQVLKFERRQYGFFAAFPAGVAKTWSTLEKYVDQFKLILSPSTGAYKHMGGFISMGKIFPPVWDWEYFWSRTAFISIILAFMNLLPIPALDGGHVVFTLGEMITGKKPGLKLLTYSQYVGMAFLLLLMVYANLNDIIRLFN